MSVTLLCLVKGNTLANAFPVHIDSNQLVGGPQGGYKSEKTNFSCNELSAINEIGDYWTEKPSKKNIHVIVEPPVTTSASNEKSSGYETVSSGNDVSRQLLKAEFDVVVSPKRKPNKWTANIEHATLEGLKDYIRELYKPPALENDGAVLNFMCDGDRYLPRNDVAFREMLQSLVSKNNLRFTVFIETPSKSFNEWTFPKVCELYGLSDDSNPNTLFHAVMLT
ncbi:hypothetical protein RhiirB3_467993 [Rhizophagus irregularis]|nr:hypothetical protein RhiirB3_467993 [Rhizophagus irregularis]